MVKIFFWDATLPSGKQLFQWLQVYNWKLPTKSIIFGQVKKCSGNFCSPQTVFFLSNGFASRKTISITKSIILEHAKYVQCTAAVTEDRQVQWRKLLKFIRSKFDSLQGCRQKNFKGEGAQCKNQDQEIAQISLPLLFQWRGRGHIEHTQSLPQGNAASSASRKMLTVLENFKPFLYEKRSAHVSICP